MQTFRYAHMVHEYYVRRLREIMARRRERIAALRSRADAEAYVRGVRRAVRRAFGPLPKRTPLNPSVTGRDSYGRYELEKVVFESRPGFLVTGNLYLPAGAGEGEKRPAVLGLCGHFEGGKAAPLYQSFAQGLALKGFVVLVIDPIAQGERRQFYPEDGGRRPGLCHAHNLMGNQMALVGDFFGTWRVWDAMRGLDYLLSRPEVDRSRVGATGNSGGGTLSAYLTALDPRLTMAAPSCFICSYLANMENELPADSEQNPPGVLAAGLDEADLLLCYAPRPTLILSQRDDYFDERYARAAYEDVRRVHALLGSPDSAEYFVGPRSHGFFQENREAMYGFFMKHAGVKGTAAERGVKPVAEDGLRALPRGMSFRRASRRVFEFTADRARELAGRRGKPSPAQVKEAAARLLAIPEVTGPPPYRVLCWAAANAERPKLRSQFAVETEPGIWAIVSVLGGDGGAMHPPRARTTLYVGHVSGLDDVWRVKEVRALARRGTFAVVDPRGIGESMAMTCGSAEFFAPYGSDFLYASTGEMLGESYLGRRVFDVLRAIDLLLAGGASEVRLVGRGMGAVTAAFAALLHPSEPRVKLLHYLPSYELIATSPRFSWPLSSLVRGCLEHFDLPDVYRALGRRLVKTQPWDERMRPARKRRRSDRA